MVAGSIRSSRKTQVVKGPVKVLLRLNQVGDADLDVENILRRHRRDRRAPDVIDPQRPVSQRSMQRRDQNGSPFCPLRIGRRYGEDLASHAHRLPVLA